MDWQEFGKSQFVIISSVRFNHFFVAKFFDIFHKLGGDILCSFHLPGQVLFRRLVHNFQATTRRHVLHSKLNIKDSDKHL